MMANEKRLIDADVLHRKVKMETNPYGKPTIDYDSGVKVLEWIDKAPTIDAVEVVRCKDCVSHGNCDSERVFTFYCGINNPFCCAGRRKTNG